MKTSTLASELFADRELWTGEIAFVPTMGALHEGHLSLFEKAREMIGAGGTVVSSIFVNPLQFDRSSDLEAYPRTLENDLALCRQLGVDYVYHPAAQTFYESDHSIQVLEKKLASHLCGATRPGHFDGVCTVVLKLLNQVRPHHAIFGKKDYQQLAIIRRLVRDLSVPVKIIAADTFRESDGLAMSSRNRNLTPEQRADAPRLRKALLAAQNLAVNGEQSREKYLAAAEQQLGGQLADFRMDYLELVSRQTLQPLAKVNEPALLALAAFYGDVRLIDNIEIDVK